MPFWALTVSAPPRPWTTSSSTLVLSGWPLPANAATKLPLRATPIVSAAPVPA